MKIAVSACLLGENCKYNGGNNYNAMLVRHLKEHQIISVCPEVLGGLSVPRVPAEIVQGIVTNAEGTCVDHEFRKGAERALEIVLKEKAELVILQSRSPSCGVQEIYDGSFSGKKIPGQGVFVELLRAQGIPVLDISEFPRWYIQKRVHDLYYGQDMNCARTTLTCLSELLNIEIAEQTMNAALGLHGAGGFRAQCGLVEGALMFLGIYGKTKGKSDKEIVAACYRYGEAFTRRFGALTCRELRPGGFREDDPPHLCEQLSAEAVMFLYRFILEKQMLWKRESGR